MLANHLNYFGLSGEVYCELNSELIKMDGNQDYFKNVCMKDCPYFEGLLQGRGIECKYKDSTAKENIVVVEYPLEFMLKRQKAKRSEKNTKYVIEGK
jgi:hypothetical protein